MSKELKVGDKILLSTGVEGVITQSFESEPDFRVEFSGGGWAYLSGLTAAGITWELAKPELPEEPPVGSVISFGGQVYERRGLHWYTVNSTYVYKWQQLIRRFRTDFTVLEDRDKTIREVLTELRNHVGVYLMARMQERFGVSLDD